MSFLHPYFRDSICNFELKLNYRYTMSCMDDVGSHANGPGWFPVDIDKDRRPYLAENTFYYKNETRFFDPSRSGIHGQYFTCKITFISIPVEMYFWKGRKIWCC